MSDEKIHYLTKESLKKLEKECTDLQDNQIPEIASKIDSAKQQGDLSENAEYHQAREEMSWAQGRLIQLQQILNNYELITEEVGGNNIALGNTVDLEINNKTKTFTIVGAQEANPSQGKISNESPLGEKLMGSKVGEKIEVRTPAGIQTYKILKIK